MLLHNAIKTYGKKNYPGIEFDPQTTNILSGRFPIGTNVVSFEIDEVTGANLQLLSLQFKGRTGAFLITQTISCIDEAIEAAHKFMGKSGDASQLKLWKAQQIYAIRHQLFQGVPPGKQPRDTVQGCSCL